MRFKLSNALIVLVLYGYLAVLLLEAGGPGLFLAGAIYVVPAMMISRAMIASAEHRRNSNALEFSRNGAANALGVQYGTFFHTFQSKEPVLESLKSSFGNALRGSLGCSELKFVALKDIDRDLPSPETRTFMLVDGKESVRGTKFHVLASFTREGMVQSLQWWILVGGVRDPNKLLWRYALAPLTVPFMLLPYIRREHDPLPGLLTVYPGFFNGIDVLTRTRELQFVAFETLVQVLDSFGVDTSDLKQQRASVLNVNVSGGKASFGSIVQGAMNKVTGTAKAANT
ncbi:MAG: hypothetical protein V5B33_18625 [Candidatus Accumulibacter sp. UW20]|jgi:hypothetical protein